MAGDKLKEFTTSIADAIRAKKKTTALIHPQDFSAEIGTLAGSVSDRTIYGLDFSQGDMEVGAGFSEGGWLDLKTEVKYSDLVGFSYNASVFNGSYACKLVSSIVAAKYAYMKLSFMVTKPGSIMIEMGGSANSGDSCEVGISHIDQEIPKSTTSSAFSAECSKAYNTYSDSPADWRISHIIYNVEPGEHFITIKLVIKKKASFASNKYVYVAGLNTPINSSSSDGMSKLTLKKPAGLIESNIAKDVELFGLTGTLEPILQEKNVTPTTSQQSVFPDSGYDGLSKLNVGAVIPSDYYKPEEVANVTPTTNAQVVTPSANAVFNQVNVSAVTSDIDENIKAENIKEGVTILGKTGTFKGGITPTGTLNITENGTFDVTNYASAEVDVPSEEPTLVTKEITENGTYTATDDNADGYSSVTVNVASSEGGSEEVITENFTSMVSAYTLISEKATAGKLFRVILPIKASFGPSVKKYVWSADGVTATTLNTSWAKGSTLILIPAYTSSTGGVWFIGQNLSDDYRFAMTGGEYINAYINKAVYSATEGLSFVVGSTALGGGNFGNIQVQYFE